MINNIITKNKKAYFDYEILTTYEAWIKLFWWEVKSVKAWLINLKWSYISFLWWNNLLKQVHISPWKNIWKKSLIETKRDIDIFLHKKDIEYLTWKQKESGFAIIPLEIYLKWSLIKVKVWLCRGRKDYDKKQVLKERTLDKEAKSYLKKILN